MSCEPQWHINGDACPSGMFSPRTFHTLILGIYLPLGITYPNDAGTWEIMGVIYGYLMWLAIMFVFVLFLVRRGTRELALLIVPGSSIAISDIIKYIAREPRPATSCLWSCGMPSGHAAVAIAFFTYLVAEVVCMLSSPDSKLTSSLIRGAYMVPNSAVSRSDLRYFVSLWSVIFLPIPVSRLVTGDHSVSQVLAGSLLGMCVGLVLFFLMLQFRLHYQSRVGNTFLCGLMVHNYNLPVGWRETVREPECPPNA